MGTSEYKKKLIDYFKRNLKKGYTVDSLKWALVNQGYSRVLVEEALLETNKDLAEKAPVLKDKPTIKYEVVDEEDNPIEIKESWWKKLFKS